MLTTIIGYSLTLAAVIPALRQVSHSRRLNSVAGISAATTIAWVFSWTVWTWYGFLVGSGPLVAHNLVGLMPALALLVVYVRCSPSMSRLTPLAIAAAYTIAAALMVVNRPSALVVITVLDVFFYVPSVVRVFKDRDLSGVSTPANAVHLTLSATWLVYLWFIGQGAASFGWIAAVLGYSLIVARLMWLRPAPHRHAAPTSSLEIAVESPLILRKPVGV